MDNRRLARLSIAFIKISYFCFYSCGLSYIGMKTPTPNLVYLSFNCGNVNAFHKFVSSIIIITCRNGELPFMRRCTLLVSIMSR